MVQCIETYAVIGGVAMYAQLFSPEKLARLVPFRVAFSGRHWSRNEEFDLVLLDETRTRAFVGEIKWSREPIAPSLMADLKQRAGRCRALEGVRTTFALISRSGFRPAPKVRRAERYVNLSALG